jgi:hypothetical protein
MALEIAALRCEQEGTKEAALDAKTAAADAAKRNDVLTIMANIAVNILCKLGSQGCQWLDLCQ